MRNTVLTILGSALLAGSLVQTASASGHHQLRKVDPAQAAASPSFRNANAYIRPAPTPVWPAPAVESDWPRSVHDEALSPPAGH
jgi:hypothetical protein